MPQNLIEIYHRPERARVDGKRLGRTRQRVDPRTLKLTHYIQDLPHPPSHASYEAKVSDWGMMLNDNLGDCVCAARGHMILQWTTYAGTPKLLTDDQILTSYKEIGDYDPRDPSTDQGCDMLTACTMWQKGEVSDGDRIAAFVSISSAYELQCTIWLFGNAYIGVALPITAQNQTARWEVVPGAGSDGEAGSWGGHCIPYTAYTVNADGTILYDAITWGRQVQVTGGFDNAYRDESYAILTEDWMETVGKSVSGFDFARLQADLAAVKSLPRPGVKK